MDVDGDGTVAYSEFVDAITSYSDIVTPTSSSGIDKASALQLVVERLAKEPSMIHRNELEFETMVGEYKNIEAITTKAFGKHAAIRFEEIVKGLVKLVDVNDFNLSQVTRL